MASEDRINEAQWPAGRFSTIIVDPPWPMKILRRRVRPLQVSLDYPIMSAAEIRALDIPSLAAEDAQLWLWTTHKHIRLALELVALWGFREHCVFTWDKGNGFSPFTVRLTTEFVILAYKGHLKIPRPERGRISTLIREKSREHSRKPELFYEIVRRLSSEPRVELFAREHRDGFFAHGFETSKFDLHKF